MVWVHQSLDSTGFQASTRHIPVGIFKPAGLPPGPTFSTSTSGVRTLAQVHVELGERIAFELDTMKSTAPLAKQYRAILHKAQNKDSRLDTKKTDEKAPV
jgi:hypothetical protein